MTDKIITRPQAKSLGLVKYFTGNKCPKGHTSLRYTSTGSCVSCIEDRKPEKLQYYRDRYNNQKDKILEKMRAHYANNKVSGKKSVKEWQSNNPEKVRQYKLLNKAKRRAAEVDRLPGWYGEFDELVVNESNDLAKLRTQVTGFAWHVDHMIPLCSKTASGLHCGLNLQVIPASLNSWKLNRMLLTNPGEWVQFA